MGVALVVALLGVVVPVLPGLLLGWAAVVLWGVLEGGTTGWSVVAAATLVAAVSQVVKYVVPGRRLQAAGVPGRTLVAGGALGVIGFFVVPVVGLPLGFVLGVYGSERQRLGDHASARAATAHALRAVGLSIVIELAAVLLVTAAWVAGLVAA